MHFLLWTKWSHESTNFDTFKCSDENFPNSSCHIQNHKPVFLQILHYSSDSLKITSLYFFGQSLYTLHKRKFWRIECWDQNSPNSCHFWNNKSSFLQILRHASASWDITPLYFFNWNFINFQQNEPIKVQIWWNLVSNRKSEILQLGCCCKNHIKF